AQQKFIDNFFGILSYTFFYSEFSSGNNTSFKPSLWDSRHLISLTTSYKLKKNWEIGARYRFSGNTPFVPTNEAETLINYPQIILDYDRLGRERLNNFSQLDIRIDKRYNFKKFSLNIFIEAQNALVQEIPTAPNFGLARDNDGNILNPRSLSSLTTSNNRIVPSIGIVADF
ncbi:MAG: TonB-dependent receptor, partial [Solirubrobacteraceae bacterium]